MTLFQTVNLCDYLVFETESDVLQLEIEGRDLPGGRENLVYRAAEMLQHRTGCCKGANIVLHKRIPAGGGLGGGSSNAAITLLVLNYLWNCGLGIEDLSEMAAELGSDVPCFLVGGPCIGWGRGEKIIVPEGLETERELILIYPGFGVATAVAYSLLDKPGVESPAELTTESLRHTIRRSEEIIEAGNYSWMSNDFEVPVFNHYPDYRALAEGIGQAGSGRLMMSGSGSVLIGAGDPSFLDTITESLKILKKQSREIEFFRCRTISRSSYTRELAKFLRYAETASRS